MKAINIVDLPLPDSNKGNKNKYMFTLSGVNVSLANALRRTILSDINTVVFNTTNYENSSKNCTIHENTSRLNNEIIKQRLSCIPIHIDDLDESAGGLDIDKHFMEINVENQSAETIYVTTADFNIINIDTKAAVDLETRNRIFPPNSDTESHIDFLRLRPRVGIIPGEKIHLTCRFSIANAKQDGMFNVVSTCAYGFTADTIKQGQILEEKKKEWSESMDEEEVIFQAKNWKLLDGLRVTLDDSFDFTIETVGVFMPFDLVIKACNIINRKLYEFVGSVSSLEFIDTSTQNTITNCYDIILKDDDYTIGKVIEYMMFSMYYESRDKALSFCGYKKMHPHDPDSILRLAFTERTERSLVEDYLKLAGNNAIEVFCKIRDIMKAKSGKK
jgi:DNA-directed RNA polymerase alpha subunit